ncbi:SAM-dependent methyltransferase [Streptomyces sp. 7N604]|uniref:SAM-dependent methyltransferase n=1 Tax=Streptomyces sp. 7N604 TaxID=3457415 RepID=UPI003FD00C94
MVSDRALWRGWREATEEALYGPDGFFVREHPAGHFRTSVHASPLFAGAVAELLARVDEALGRPDALAVVDVGAGRGELLAGVLGAVPRELGARLRLRAVERAERPEDLDERIEWLRELPEPESVTGLLFANEWLDDVPVDVAEWDASGTPRTVLVAPDGSERLGAQVTGADAAWLRRWWPPEPPVDPLAGEPGSSGDPGLGAGINGPRDAAYAVEADAQSGEARDAAPSPVAGLRAEVGRPRDAAWARAVRCLARGLAVAVDYGHTRTARPPFGSLTGFRDGREVQPVPDGSCDITAHVALDACASAGAEAVPGGARDPVLLPQRHALRALGVAGGRPPLALASSDPAAYVRALSSAGEAAELTDPAGLGAFTWLIQPMGLAPEFLTATGLARAATGRPG